MSDIKCPFCGQKLEEETFYRGRVFVFCNNPNCILFDYGGCSKQAIIELIRTRKALDVAVDKLKGIKAYYDDSYADPHFVNWHIVAQRLANDAEDSIKAITALEQKDVK